MIKKIKLTITSILFFMLCLNSFAQVTSGNDSNGKFYDVVIDGPDANLTVNFSITRALDEHNTGAQTGTKRRGKVNISPSGGTPPYSYNLYKVGTTAPVRTGTISSGNKEEDNLLPGSYFVEVYDNYYSGAKPAAGTGCNHKKSVTRTLTNPKLLKIRGSITASITCFNGQGAITAYVQGGIGNYRVQLIQGSSITEKSATNAVPPSERPVVFGGLGDGTYTLKVIDSKNVVKQTASIILNQPPLFVLNGSSVNVTKNVTCNAGSDGVITIQPSGGTKPYRVVVRKGSSTIVNTTYNSNNIVIGNLTAGSYAITVNDIHNCSLKTFTRTVTQPAVLSITATPRSTKGVGNNDGEVDFEIEGGTPNTAGYTYTFEGANLASPNPRTGSIVVDASGNYKKTFTGLKKGTYKLTIVDNTGVCTTNRTISIIDPAPLVINSVNSTNVDCNGEATGTISVTASGGFQPTYRFELFKKNATTPFKTENTNPSVTTYTFTSGIRAGEYRVKVSVIVAGSVVETEERASIIITDNPPIQLGTSGITDAKCKGGNGGITFPVSGGVGPYTYQWRRKGSSTVLSTSRDFTGNNAKAGIYNLTVTDSKSCSIISSDTEIEEPTNALSVTNNGAPVNLTINIQDLPTEVQPDGKIRMNISGGWGNYRYKWTDESNNVVGSNKDLIDVKAGKYTLEVTDRNGTGCKIIRDFMIEEPARLEINISLSPFGELNCFGDVDGSLTVEIKGATPSKYSYSWYEKNADGSLNFKASNQLTISDLESGDYGVEVEMTNNNNVVVKKYPVNDFILRAPDPITINNLNTRENKIECFGETGSIQIEVKGGTGTYRYFYKKDGGAESAKIPFTSGKSTLIPNLLEGNYEVKILDQNNCSPKETDGTEKILNFTLTEPTKLAFDNANSSASDATGFGVSDGSISVTAKDGTPFTNASGSYYEYYLVEKGSTTVLGTTSTVTGLAGSETGIIYVMTIKDANSCTETKEFTIKQPEQLLVSFSPNPSFIRCNGEKGIINASANGGVPFTDASGKPYYEYQWYNTNDLATVVETSEVLTDVAGTYKLIVTDVNGNVAITKDASGGIIPSEAELKENPVVEVTFTKQDVKCKGDATGSILLDVKGGTGVYTYRWSHDNGLNTNDISGLTVGKYTVRVTDENGCFDSSKEILEIEILEPTTNISIDSSADIIVDATGFGVSDGSISITAKGGTPFTNASGSYYEYSLVEKGSTTVLGTTSTVTGLAGSVSGITYVMTVKDANDCTISKEYLVKEPSELQVELSVTSTIDCNGEDGTLSSTVTGGFLKTGESYNYEWYNVNDLTTVVSISSTLTAKAGTYKLIVTDSNGNVALTRNASGAVIPSEIELKENPVVEVTFTKQDVKCKGDATGSILLDVKGGTGVYTYRWSHDSSLNTNDISGLIEGKYTVRVTDENGCFDPSKEILEIEILEPTTNISIDSSADIIVDATGFGVSDGSISITAKGGTPFTNASGSYYEYSLVEKGSTTVLGTTSTVTGLAGSVSGITYVMTVKDANDCTISKEYLVKEPSELQVELSVTSTIDCNGEDGTLSSTVTGGFLKTGESYNYEWYNVNDLTTVVSTSSTLTAKAGTYKLVVTDSNGNVALTRNASGAVIPSEAELKENPVVEVTFTKQDVKCKGNATGSILLDVKGGTGVYTYRWSHDSSLNTNDISGLTAGKYTVRVTDENGCFDPSKEILEIEILEPTTNISIDSSADIIVDATGFGVSDGSISITAKGGTPFTNASGSYYEYSLVEKGSTTVLGTTSTVTGLAGSVSGITYVITVKDANDCTISKEYLVKEPSELQVELSVFSIIKCNGEDGTLSSAVTGGVPFLDASGTSYYEYEWYNTNDLTTVVGRSSTLVAKTGIYKLVVTDANGNVALTRDTSGLVIPSEKELKENLPLTIRYNPTVDVTNVTCYNGVDGSINITVEGGTGTGTYIYDWSNGDKTEDITSLVAGDYKIDITDANNCRTSALITITQPDLYKIETALFKTPTGAGLSDGSIRVNVLGGTQPYSSYSWKDANGLEISKTKEIIDVEAGKYIFTVKDSRGCELSTEFNLDQPDPLLISIQEIGSIQCNADTSGVLELVTSGGVGGNTYTWYNATTNIDIGNGTRITGQGAGSYYVTVKDANDIEKTSSIYTIVEPTAVTVSSSSTNLSCFESADGEISLSAAGGTGLHSYRYRKDGRAYGAWIEFTSNTKLSGLSIGNYEVQIKDANDCFLVESGSIKVLDFQITQPAILTLSETITEVTGFGLSNGAIDITVIGGTQPYTYSWTDASGNLVANTEDISNLTAGIYTLTFEDAQGCTLNESFTVQQPDELLISIQEIGSIQCNTDTSGVLELITSGGIGGNVYTWYNATTNVDIGNATRITGQGAGSYYVTVKDTNGNEATSSIYTILEPTAVTVSSSSTNLSCFESADGEISLSAAGGTGLHSYRYRKDGGAYGTWVEFTSNTKLSGLSIGNYEVQIKDANDCFLVESGSIKVLDFQITQPAILTLSETITEVTGFGLSNGAIDITVTGGTQPYTYSWTDASGNLVANTEDISNLTAGIYTLTFEDAQGCTLNESFTVQQPDELLISIQEIGSIQCNADTSGVLELITSGGIGGNVYTWYNATTNVDIGNATRITGQGAGSYYVTVKDTNGNEATSSIYTIVEPTAVTVTSSSVNLSCFESADGEISLSAAGGTGLHSYRYRKDGGAYGTWIEFTSNTKLSGLSIGNYEVQIKDANDCFLVESGSIKVLDFQITQPVILTLSETITEVTGFGLSNGAIDITVTGGTQPYTYSWTDASGSLVANTEDISNLTAGTYTLTFEDAQGCTLNQSFTVKQPNLLEVSVQQQAIVFCKGDKTASITSNVTGGMLPYTYEWFEKGNTTVLTTNSTLQNIGTGIYYVIVRDVNNNQTQSLDINISEPEILAVDVNPISAGCGTTDDWTIEANVSGGTPPYSYFWNTGERTQKIENKSLGSYFVVITDANGCRTTENIVLENNSPLTVTETVKEIVCYNQCSGEIDLQITGGVAPYTVVWNSGQTTSFVTNLCSGDYTVEVKDQKGCSIVKTIKLVNPEEFIFELVPNEVTLCYEESIVYDVTMNGIAKYSWTSDNGFKSNSSTVSLTEGGNYTLTVTTDEGCTVSKELKITKSDVIIDSQLILSSQAFVGEDIAIINVSNPFSANVEWDIPSNVKVVQKEAEGVVLRFVAPGDYDISLVSIEGNCKKKATKTVNVLKQRNLPDVGDVTGPFIKEFEVYSNPNKGQFKVDIELEKEAEISLRLFNLGANSIEVDKRLKGKKEYTIDYNMNVSAGVYVLLLETAKSKRIRKVVIE